MKKIFISLVIFSVSLSAYAQLDVVITDDGVAGGRIQIKNDENHGNALTAITNGEGLGLFGSNTATVGIRIGVMGASASNTHGTGVNSGVTGVLGQITAATPGGYSAGVRGVVNSIGGTGIGVAGYHAGGGWGVVGETSYGFGVYGMATKTDGAGIGVRGEAFGSNGIGVEAKYSGAGIGTALEIENGAIKVAGANKAAFVHTATVANKLSNNGTDVDNPMCNGDPNCFLFVTQKLGSGVAYNNSPIGVYYNNNRSKWEIFNETNTPIPTNAQFNVLIIKQ